MEQLYEILNEFAEDVDFKTNTHLVDDKVLTSLNLVKLIVKLNEAFDVRISVVHLTPENFNSAEAIYNLITSLE